MRNGIGMVFSVLWADSDIDNKFIDTIITSARLPGLTKIG